MTFAVIILYWCQGRNYRQLHADCVGDTGRLYVRPTDHPCTTVCLNHCAGITGDIGKTVAIDWQVHGLNGVLTFIDAFVTSRRVRKRHVWLPMTLGLIYVIWSIIHYATGLTTEGGNRYIYR